MPRKQTQKKRVRVGEDKAEASLTEKVVCEKEKSAEEKLEDMKSLLVY